MKYIMTGRNVEVTQAMQEYAEKKLSRIEKFFNPDTEATVTFSVEAAASMKKRFIGKFESDIADKNIPEFRTIHSLALSIIKY